jgi:FkbM family methyltransferase
VSLRTVTRSTFRRGGIDLARWPRLSELELHLGELLAVTSVDCAIDVGGHVGGYGLLLRRLGYQGRIISFEPVPEHYAVLSGHAHSDPAWTTVQAAVGEADGTAQLNVSRGASLESFLASTQEGRSRHGAAIDVARVELVSVVRLDSAITPAEGTEFLLKSDTQGFDLHVVESAGTMIDAISIVQIELALTPDYEDAATLADGLQTMDSLGFALTGLFSGYRDRQLRLHEVDCVFRRAHSRVAVI